MYKRCYAPGCDMQVIGQCTGYKEGCGHFYCSTHSTGQLCADCVNEAAKVMAQDYQATAESLEKKYQQELKKVEELVTFTNTFPQWSLGWIILFFLIASIIENNTKDRTIALFAAVVVPTIVILVAYLLWGQPRQDAKHAAQNELEKWFYQTLAALDKEKPGFRPFFLQWQQKKPEDRKVLIGVLAGALAVAGVIIAAGLVGAALDENRKLDDQVRRRQELEDSITRAIKRALD